jgi:WD40 repeat protein
MSHSSLDNRQALALRQWLIDHDHSLKNEIFLDLHPDAGISSGDRWMDALRAASTRCEAVICLLSANWEASAFCKAEYFLAELLSKKVFSARIDALAGEDPTRGWQQIDLFGEGPTAPIDIGDGGSPVEFSLEGLSRLRAGIAKAGIGAQSFPWPPPQDSERAPYRGWDPLDEADAAVFFGRDAQIIGGLDALRRMRSTGETLFVVHGPSGSGKSSFLRAGLLPRLRREDRDFVILDIVRPQGAPLSGATGFAAATSATRSRFELTGPTQGDIEQACRKGEVAQVRHWLQDVQHAARTRLLEQTGEGVLPTLVVPVDQAEELFGADAGVEAPEFLHLVAELARPADGQNPGPLGFVVALTIRADRYQELQDAPQMVDVRSVAFTALKPMPRTLFKDVITGPAERASHSGAPLQIETGLITRLLDDCTEGADTLPLLALTLSLLFTKYRRVPVGESNGPSGHRTATPRLMLADYENMGGIGRVVQTEIDGQLDADPTQRAAELATLRTAFIPWLATINPANDQPLRRIARWTDLPAHSHPLLKRLINRRLLVRDDRDGVGLVEVALESLLRQWDELVAWLAEERVDLKQADTLELTSTAWATSGNDDWLLYGSRLTDAEALLLKPGFRERLAPTVGLVQASRRRENERAEAEKQQQEKQLRDAEAHAAALQKRSQILRRVLIATAVVAVIAVIGAAVAVVQTKKAGDATQQALNRYKEATAARLDAEGAAILSDNHAGTDAQAFQEVLAAHALRQQLPKDANSPPPSDDGPILDALVKRHTTIRMVDAGGLVVTTALSPTGDRIATNVGGAVRLWNVDTGRPIGQPLPRDTGVTYSGVAFSPDGTRVAANSIGGNGGKVRMFEAGTDHHLERTFTGPDQDSSHIVFSPDGHRIAAGYADGTAWVWNVDTGAPELTLTGFHHGAVNTVAFSPDGAPGDPLIATGSDDQTVQLWNAVTGHHVRAITAPGMKSVATVAFSSGGFNVAAGDLNVAIRVWNPATGDLSTEMLDSGAVRSVAWNPTRLELASAGASGVVRLWHFPDSGIPANTPLPGHLGETNDVTFSADGQRIAAGGTDGIAQVWSPVLDEPINNANLVTGVGYSRDGQTVGAAGYDGKIQLFSSRTAAPLGDPLLGHSGKLTSIAFDPVDDLLAAGGQDGTVPLWDPARSEPVRTLPGNAEVNSVAFSKDGALLASGSADHKVRLWNPHTGTPARPALTGPTEQVNSVAFSPVQHLVAASSADHKIYVWDTDTGQLQHTIATPDAVGPVAFSPDGHRIASGGGNDNMVRVWNVDSGQPAMYPLTGHTGTINAVLYSPDGRFIASASNDGHTRFWDAATGQAVGSPLTQPAASSDQPSSVSSIAFSPDGRQLVSGSVDRNLRLWPGSPVAAELCGKLTTNPSDKQWKRWVAPDIPSIPLCPGLPPSGAS